MPITNTQAALDDACRRLHAAILNPYAVERYLARPKQIEQLWKDFAKKPATKKISSAQ